MEIKTLSFKTIIGFIYLLETYPEFRSLFYYRIGDLKYLIKWLSPPRRNLSIAGNFIGEKLYVHLGYSTIIAAKSLGKNCKIYQQVTIGSANGSPIIGDNVTIFSGAIIVGNIRIGNNVQIGANATVYKDIPDNTTVYPPKSLQMTWTERKTGGDLSSEME